MIYFSKPKRVCFALQLKEIKTKLNNHFFYRSFTKVSISVSASKEIILAIIFFTDDIFEKKSKDFYNYILYKLDVHLYRYFYYKMLPSDFVECTSSIILISLFLR